MASFTFQFSDADAQRILNAFSIVGRYDPARDGNQRDFVIKQIKDYIRNTVKRTELDFARANAIADAEAQIGDISVSGT